ncbi:MAG: DUF721 domain-containing protein [Planctomycetes bacterium]|jgi:predicted nucleic acid-binding Zn ribbon protein|nr:DUF721 domain-containing protein [Planctomycetota bacterium]
MADDPRLEQMERLRAWRARPQRDVTLGFLRDTFKREVEKPFKQLEGLTELWAELVPEQLAAHTRLESLSRGVLRVVVDSAGRHYELDRLLREGLQRELTRRHKGAALRQVKVRVGKIDPS